MSEWVLWRVLEISQVEIMSQLKLDHHGKPGSTGRLFRPSMGLLSSAHPPFRTLRDSNPGPTGFALEHVTIRPLSRHPKVLVSHFNQSTKLSDTSTIVFSELLSHNRPG
ncbi:unnamed protein product [Schistosoma curassoni]|nr:unnamed protein product [Schistosoma curassoni]